MRYMVQVLTFVLAVLLSGAVFADGKSRGGDEFRATAKKYDEKAAMYGDKGMSEVSELYVRQAEIKREAAGLADEGRWGDIDWSEYHKNEGKINEVLQEKKHKK